MRSLAGAHAIVTGGSRGIGLAIAKHFASEGASITLVGRDEARLQTALKSLDLKPGLAPLATPPNHATFAFNVANLTGWQLMMKQLKTDKVRKDETEWSYSQPPKCPRGLPMRGKGGLNWMTNRTNTVDYVHFSETLISSSMRPALLRVPSSLILECLMSRRS